MSELERYLALKLTGIPRLEFYEWANMIEAEFSTPCAVAMAVAGEEPGLTGTTQPASCSRISLR